MQSNIVDIIQNNPNAWSEYITHENEIGFTEDLKAIETVLLTLDDIEARTSFTCSVVKFVFFHVFNKLSLEWDENIPLAEMCKAVEATRRVRIYGTYTCLDAMENRVLGSTYDTRNFTKRILLTLYYIVNSVFKCNLDLSKESYGS